jgi:hypothetical protein
MPTTTLKPDEKIPFHNGGVNFGTPFNATMLGGGKPC